MMLADVEREILNLHNTANFTTKPPARYPICAALVSPELAGEARNCPDHQPLSGGGALFGSKMVLDIEVASGWILWWFVKSMQL